MKVLATKFLLFLLASTATITTTDAFQQIQPTFSRSSRLQQSSTSSSSSQLESQSSRPDLVDQTLFVNAVERIEDEISMAIAEQEGGQEGGQYVELQQQQQQQQQQDTAYAIGRIFVDLPVDTQPELDLTESTGPLVLVTGVWGRTAEISGLQMFDTITKVTVGSSAAELSGSGEYQDGTIKTAESQTSATTFVASCKQRTLEETAAVLTAAAQHALQQGKTEIQLEINRLIQGYYATPPTQ
jgi:hypothetical protein